MSATTAEAIRTRPPALSLRIKARSAANRRVGGSCARVLSFILASVGVAATPMARGAFRYPSRKTRVHSSVDTEWIAVMRRGDFPAAWKISDRVLAARDPGQRDDPRLPYHLRWVWDGRAFQGRHVLVRCY